MTEVEARKMGKAGKGKKKKDKLIQNQIHGKLSSQLGRKIISGKKV